MHLSLIMFIYNYNLYIIATNETFAERLQFRKLRDVDGAVLSSTAAPNATSSIYVDILSEKEKFFCDTRPSKLWSSISTVHSD